MKQSSPCSGPFSQPKLRDYRPTSAVSFLFDTLIFLYHYHNSRQGAFFNHKILGPVVQSMVRLMSSLVVKMLTFLVSTISNSLVFLLKNVSSFANAKATHIFQQKKLACMPYLMSKVLKIC